MHATREHSGRSRAAHLGPERRRPQVLDAAREIAVRDGLGAVSIGSVASHLRVTRPVIYACFADRVELVEALLEREGAALLDSVVEALHGSGITDDSEQAFVSGFRALLASAQQRPDSWRLLLSGQPDPAVSARFADARAMVHREATAWIGPAMRRWWRTTDLDRKLPVLIELFISSCESAIRSLLADGNEWTAEELGAFVGAAVHRAFRDA